MGMPSTLKAQTVILDGTNMVGVVGETTIPKFVRKMNDWRGGGMPAGVKLDDGYETPELDFTLGGLRTEGLRQWGANAYDAAQVEFRGEFKNDDGSSSAMQIIAHGRYSEIDFGKAKDGDATSHQYKMTCASLQLIVDGTEWLMLDAVAMIERVFGTDRLAETRAALAL